MIYFNHLAVHGINQWSRFEDRIPTAIRKICVNISKNGISVFTNQWNADMILLYNYCDGSAVGVTRLRPDPFTQIWIKKLILMKLFRTISTPREKETLPSNQTMDVLCRENTETVLSKLRSTNQSSQKRNSNKAIKVINTVTAVSALMLRFKGMKIWFQLHFSLAIRFFTRITNLHKKTCLGH